MANGTPSSRKNCSSSAGTAVRLDRLHPDWIEAGRRKGHAAEVTVGGDTYILIANTSTTASTATVTLLEEGVAPLPITVDLPPSSRISVPVSRYLPATNDLPKRRFGALIETNGVEIVVERAIYATVGGITWGAGTAALGTKLQ